MWSFLGKEGVSIPACDAAIHQSTILSTLIKDVGYNSTIPLTGFTAPELELYNNVMMLDHTELLDHLTQLSHAEVAVLYNIADFLDVPILCDVCPTVILEKLRSCEDVKDAVSVYFGSLTSGLGE